MYHRSNQREFMLESWGQITFELSLAHEHPSDHSGLVRRLTAHLKEGEEITESAAAAAAKYLTTNLKQNIQLVDSVCCLPMLYPHLSDSAKRSITSLIRQKYPREANFFRQIELLRQINCNLIPPFLKVISALCLWFSAITEQKSYQSNQSCELEYIADSVYALQRCKCDLQISIDHSSGESILVIYRLLEENPEIHQSSEWAELRNGILHSCFYFLANYDITHCVDANKYYFSAVRALIDLLKWPNTFVHCTFIELILPKLKKGTVQSPTEQTIDDVLLFLRRTIINILLSCWSVQAQHFWLWRYKLFCDLLDIDDQLQYSLIDQMQQLFKGLSKMFNL